MKFEKKHWAMLIGGVVVLFLVYWFFFRKKLMEAPESGYAANMVTNGFPNMETNYSGNDTNGLLMIGKGEFSPLPMYNQDTAAAINESGYNFRNFGGEAYQAKVNDGTPVSRIKYWGGKMENGVHMCFDDGIGKFVPCPRNKYPL
jgi:hypothetical protein